MAENRLNAFHDIQLVNPVKDNLARKLTAMKQALREFEAVIDYGVSTVTPAATHQIGSLYYEMSRALLTSEQPKSLTAEELVEYEVLLAEQAAPFTQQAIDVYSTNVRRSSGDALNPWVEKSAQRLVELQQHWSSGATADAN